MKHTGTISRLTSLGASITKVKSGQGAVQLVVSHRGATVDVWPASGLWRPRRIGYQLARVRRDGIDALVSLLTGPIPDWMTQRAAKRQKAKPWHSVHSNQERP